MEMFTIDGALINAGSRIRFKNVGTAASFVGLPEQRVDIPAGEYRDLELTGTTAVTVGQNIEIERT